MADRRILRAAFATAMCVVLAACNQSGRPRNVAAPKPAPAAAPMVSPADYGKVIGNAYIVAPGDTLAVVADRTNTTVRALIDMNNLKQPYALTPGMRLALRPGGAMAVEAPPPATPVGSVGAEPLPAPSMPQTTAPGASISSESLPPPPGAPAGTSSSPSVGMKPIVEPEPVTPAPAASSTATKTVLPAPSPQTEPSPAPVPSKPAGAAPVQSEASPSPDSGAATSASVSTAPAAGSGHGQFAWPVQGKVISEFGSSKDGTKNDGINIAAPSGAPVVAAADGVVAYAGNELRGFGNMILIRHDSGYVTAYAHNASLLVKKGDKVKRGQTIARVGATGAVFGPQLHFEIRKGTQPVDPMSYLGG